MIFVLLSNQPLGHLEADTVPDQRRTGTAGEAHDSRLYFAITCNLPDQCIMTSARNQSLITKIEVTTDRDE